MADELLLQRDWRVPERLKRELAGLYSLQAYPQAVPMSIITGQSVGRFLLAIEASELTFVFALDPRAWRSEVRGWLRAESKARRAKGESRPSERNIHQQIGPFLTFRATPDQQQLIDRSPHADVLTDDEDSRACAVLDEDGEVQGHGSPIVTNENAIVLSRARKYL